MIDNVKKLAVSEKTKSTQLDIKSEYLFRACSVLTNLVTSLEYNPIRCATMLCYFGQTRNSYVALFFNLHGSIATSKAADDYVGVWDHFGQNGEPAGRKEERTRKKPSLFPKVEITDALTLQTCNHDFSFFYASSFFKYLMSFMKVSH